MDMLRAYGVAACAVLAMMILVWVLSVVKKDVSLVDRFWGFGFVVIAWTLATSGRSLTPLKTLLLILVSIWGLRLSLYIHFRNRGHEEDYRYKAMRAVHGATFWWTSFFRVFLVQGIIMLLVAMPVIFGMSSDLTTSIGSLAYVGTFIWFVGFVFEAGGDWQLQRFKANSMNRGKILQSGLWSLTRHPNYFGDAMQWWGLGVITLGYGGIGVLSLIGPAIMTFFIRKISGVDLLEANLKNSKPGFAAYMASTPAFLPKWPFWSIILLISSVLYWVGSPI